MQECSTGKTWSLGLNPMPDNNDYIVKYGFGYAKYLHTSMEIMQELTVFVPRENSAKINLLNLKNLAPKKKKIKLVYYIKPVFGEDEIISNGYLELENKANSNTIIIKNRANDKEEYVYVSSSEKIKSYTGNKRFFIGSGTLANPEALNKVSLNNENSLGTDNIIAIQIELQLEAFESKEISFILGTENDIVSCLDNSYKYSKTSNCNSELEKVKKYWNELTQIVQVKTPIESFNILLNGWLVYQTLVCRLWARTGFYQSGGAFGFRDQLQDTLGLKYFDTDFMKEQIIKHSKHQFIEGDVEHWWHDESGRGIRTKFSDDLLWLVYVTIEYIEQTGDYTILNIETSYKKGVILEDGVDERYDLYEDSDIKESIYKHCIRAIEKALNFGENGLPKMGSGDWNDGMNTVGNKGKGESVWLGFFLYDILNRFIPIIEVQCQQTNCRGRSPRRPGKCK
jgi:cellobiose phosphorylase